MIKTKFKKLISFVLCAVLMFSLPVSGFAKEDTAESLMNDIVYTYKTKQLKAHKDIQSLIERLKVIDPELGKAWQNIMDYWEYCNYDITLNSDILPDGLPEDDSLAIIVLGFELNSDGSMKEELIGRCEVALSCAEKYPEAAIIVTGGGTAKNNHEVTEADSMAQWLIEKGVDEERIYIENTSLTTVQNAAFTYDILKEQLPQVTDTAIVSSDYHVPLGCLLFNEEFILAAYKEGTEPVRIISNACYLGGNSIYEENIKQQAADVWSIKSILDE